MGGNNDRQQLLLAGGSRPLRACTTSAISNWRKAAPFAACKLAYATFGTLNAARDNAILVPTWYSGTNKIIEQVYIGKGRALDPDKYFIVVVNQIGSGLSTSPHNTPAPAGMGNFPHVRIGDDVRAQHKLVTEKFDLKSLALVVGGSMGAQQTYEWAVRYPDMVKRAAPDRRHRQEHRP